jgi:hypothetical protein
MGTPLEGAHEQTPIVVIESTLSGEEWGPTDLVRIARLAEERVGPDQDGADRFYENEVLPKIG